MADNGISPSFSDKCIFNYEKQCKGFQERQCPPAYLVVLVRQSVPCVIPI